MALDVDQFRRDPSNAGVNPLPDVSPFAQLFLSSDPVRRLSGPFLRLSSDTSEFSPINKERVVQTVGDLVETEIFKRMSKLFTNLLRLLSDGPKSNSTVNHTTQYEHLLGAADLGFLIAEANSWNTRDSTLLVLGLLCHDLPKLPFGHLLEDIWPGLQDHDLDLLYDLRDKELNPLLQYHGIEPRLLAAALAPPGIENDIPRFEKYIGYREALSLFDETLSFEPLIDPRKEEDLALLIELKSVRYAIHELGDMGDYIARNAGSRNEFEATSAEICKRSIDGNKWNFETLEENSDPSVSEINFAVADLGTTLPYVGYRLEHDGSRTIVNIDGAPVAYPRIKARQEEFLKSTRLDGNTLIVSNPVEALKYFLEHFGNSQELVMSPEIGALGEFIKRALQRAEAKGMLIDDKVASVLDKREEYLAKYPHLAQFLGEAETFKLVGTFSYLRFKGCDEVALEELLLEDELILATGFKQSFDIRYAIYPKSGIDWIENDIKGEDILKFHTALSELIKSRVEEASTFENNESVEVIVGLTGPLRKSFKFRPVDPESLDKASFKKSFQVGRNDASAYFAYQTRYPDDRFSCGVFPIDPVTREYEVKGVLQRAIGIAIENNGTEGGSSKFTEGFLLELSEFLEHYDISGSGLMASELFELKVLPTPEGSEYRLKD